MERAKEETGKDKISAEDVAISQIVLLTIEIDSMVESPQAQEDVRWHWVMNAYRTREILTDILSGIEKLESG